MNFKRKAWTLCMTSVDSQHLCKLASSRIDMIDSDFTIPFLTLVTKRLFVVISVIGRCGYFVCAHGLIGGAISVDIGRRSTARNQLVSRTSFFAPFKTFVQYTVR